MPCPMFFPMRTKDPESSEQPDIVDVESLAQRAQNVSLFDKAAAEEKHKRPAPY